MWKSIDVIKISLLIVFGLYFAWSSYELDRLYDDELTALLSPVCKSDTVGSYGFN